MDRGLPTRAAILLHKVDKSDRNDLVALIRALKAVGYSFVDPDRYVTASPADDLVLLTFDDNFRCWLEVADVLEQERVTATFYVNSLPFQPGADLASYYSRIGYHSRIGKPSRPEPLRADDLRQLAAAGHTIGSHTKSHFNLGVATKEFALAEILECKSHLEELLGQEVGHFAYPFGRRSDCRMELAGFLRSEGIRTIASARAGLLHTAPSSWLIHRTPWSLVDSVAFNLSSLRLDGRRFEAVTGRFPLAGAAAGTRPKRPFTREVG
jgi:Polysaccharide deacetylase